MTVFFRVLDPSVDGKQEALLTAIRRACVSEPSRADVPVFELSPESFRTVPGSPFAYWVSDAVRAIFVSTPRLEAAGERTAAVGLQTSDDFRFVRAVWEVPQKLIGSRWFGFAKGGSFSPFYADVFLAMNWLDDGAEAKAWAGSLYNQSHWSRILKNTHLFFRPGLTWPLRTNGLSFRALPAGCVFGHKGPAAYVEDNSTDKLLALAALLNSRPFGYLVSVQLARTELAQSYEVGLIQQTPIPSLSSSDISKLSCFARRAWWLRRALDTIKETSHAFLLPAGLNEKFTVLDRAANERELDLIQNQIDDFVFSLYGIVPEDRQVIEASLKRIGPVNGSEESPVDDDSDDDTSEDEEAFSVVRVDMLHSWLVGVAFGRFDPGLATGERAIPSEPEPFDPLPILSPGMYPEGKEPADRPDVLVDDEGHPDDIAARARVVAERVQVDASENLRGWLAREFFPLHIKMYSKSRRKAPIYWQLASPSASYSVWLYIHAFGKDTLFRVQNDYAAPKLAHEERRLDALVNELREGATAVQRKELAAQELLVEELRAFLDEVKRVAPLWNPNLDDGVVINFAPLWRLVPQNKSWQKELKSTWDAICEGKYDWAHLAMHLWPERVVPKCVTDRSLAIAHGLEDVFWVEGTDGKWSARKTPTRSLTEVMRERTSAAVKSALKNLLEAPVATQARANRGRRAASESAIRRGDR